jgi:hypothetical protein
LKKTFEGDFILRLNRCEYEGDCYWKRTHEEYEDMKECKVPEFEGYICGCPSTLEEIDCQEWIYVNGESRDTIMLKVLYWRTVHTGRFL